MKFDVNRVLDGVSDSLVVRDTVDLTFVRYHGLSPFTTPVSLTAQALVQDGVVTLDCVYSYRLELVCDRCLTPFTKERVPCAAPMWWSANSAGRTTGSSWLPRMALSSSRSWLPTISSRSFLPRSSVGKRAKAFVPSAAATAMKPTADAV